LEKYGRWLPIRRSWSGSCSTSTTSDPDETCGKGGTRIATSFPPAYAHSRVRSSAAVAARRSRSRQGPFGARRGTTRRDEVGGRRHVHASPPPHRREALAAARLAGGYEARRRCRARAARRSATCAGRSTPTGGR
jgi:hypothetical protein